MSIYLQRLVPIQPRTSPLKFDHSVEKLGVEYGIVSLNLDRDRADGGGHAHAGGDPRLRASRGVLAHPLEPVLLSLFSFEKS